MINIPNDIDLQILPGPRRGKDPALYYDDKIIWSPRGNYFALAYTIIEATYGNNVGNILWGSYDGQKSKILGNPTGIGASCWKEPWCKWLNDESFIFKAQKYDNKSVHVPLVIINVSKGFMVLNGSSLFDKWFDGIMDYDGTYLGYDEQALIRSVINT